MTTSLPLVDLNPVTLGLASDGSPIIILFAGADETSLQAAGDFLCRVQNREFDGVAFSEIQSELANFPAEVVFGNPNADTLIDDARIIDGTVPGRSSAIMETSRINGFLNRLDFSTLTLAGQLFDDTDNTFTITAEIANSAQGGFVLFGGNDTIIGSEFPDNIGGNTGNDLISAGGDADVVRGGRDDDTLNGDGGNDILHGNKGNDIVNGDVGQDFLRGGQGADLLNGGDDSDWLIGDRDLDTLTGGAGADTFLLRTEVDLSTDANAVDVITDFSTTDGDKIAIFGEVSALSATASDADVLIKIDATTFIAKVLNASIAEVEAALSVVPVTDAAAVIG